MIVRRINIISFIGLAILLLFGYGRINSDIHLISTCVLLMVFTSATMMDFLIISERNDIGVKRLVLVIIVGLFAGYLSGVILGSQRHDVRDGGPSFGMETWPFVLDIIYPICFSIFALCLSYLKGRPIKLGILFAWIISTLVYGYVFGDYHAFFEIEPTPGGLNYDSTYFPSATKTVTPLLAGTVLFWTLWILLESRVLKTSSRQQGL